MDKKYIRFIDSQYNTLFHVADGGKIRINCFDGKKMEFECKYLDPYHVEISGNCYHICQFAEFMERNGNTYEPVKEIGDLDFYTKKFFDRDNVDTDGKPIPYYNLVELCFEQGTSIQQDVNYAFCLFPASPDKTFCKFVHFPNDSVDGVSVKKEFAPNIEDLCADENLCARMRNMVKSIHDERNDITSSLDAKITSAQQEQKLAQSQTEKSHRPIDKSALTDL